MTIPQRTQGAATLAVATCIIALISCDPRSAQASSGKDRSGLDQAAAAVDYGPALDRIIFEAQADPARAISQIAAGEADLLLDPVPPAVVRGIAATDLAGLELAAIPAESWSVLINPIPNKAPYTWKAVNGETSFNPLAIREVRYALNWLFDRQKLINDILGGQGSAGFTPLPPGLPGTSAYTAVPTDLGLSPTGDANKALEEITDAMNTAARLPENTGRLRRATDGVWQYDGKPVSLKILMRADEPAGRLPFGRYLAAQLEKAGFAVQRLEAGRSSLAQAYFSDPADIAFHIYTESWARRTGKPSWELTLAQQYAPAFGYLPGGAEPSWWHYQNPELDRLAEKITTDLITDDKDQLADSQKVLELGLREAVRIYLAYLHESFIRSASRFKTPLEPDPVTGFSGRSLRTAKIAPDGDKDSDGNVAVGGDTADENGEHRTLRIFYLQSADGEDQNPGTWNSTGPDGFATRFAKTIAELVSDSVLVSDIGLVSDSGSLPGNGQTGQPATGTAKPAKWHNGISLDKADAEYLAAPSNKQATGELSGRGVTDYPAVLLPWDLYAVLDRLGSDKVTSRPESSFDLISPKSVKTILAEYREILEVLWIPPALEGLTSPEEAATRYRASIAFIERSGHALISNGPFVLASLNLDTGRAELKAFEDYPYGSDYSPLPARK